MAETAFLHALKRLHHGGLGADRFGFRCHDIPDQGRPRRLFLSHQTARDIPFRKNADQLLSLEDEKCSDLAACHQLGGRENRIFGG